MITVATRIIKAVGNLVASAIRFARDAVTRAITFTGNAVTIAINLAKSGIKTAIKGVAIIGDAILQFVKGLVGVLENVIGYILSRIANAIVAIAGFIAALSQIGTEGVVSLIVGINDTQNQAARRMQAQG